MKDGLGKYRKWLNIGLLWLLVSIGVLLRTYRADEYPISQNDDGLFHIWAGTSVFEDWKNPTSLTIFEKENPNVVWRSQYKPLSPVEEFGFRLTDKYFDQPLLAILLISLPAKIFGYFGYTQLPHMIVRLPALIASVFTLLLTYKLAKELFSRSVGYWSLMVLCFWPLAVWSQRQSFLENIISPWLLSSLLGLYWYEKNKSNRNLLIIIMSGIAATWSKVIGLSVPLFSTFWMGFKKRKGEVNKIIGFTLLSVIAYVVYGWLAGGYDFFSTIINQGSRGAYFTSLFHVFTHPETFHEVVADGWWFLGILALFSMSRLSSDGAKLVSLSSIFWLVVIFATSGPENTSPWYRYPIYPLMSIAVGQVLDSIWRKKNIFWPLVIYMLGMTGWSLSGFEINSGVVRVGLLLVLVLFGFEYVRDIRVAYWIRRVALILLVTVCMVGNVFAIYKVPRIYCQLGRCLVPEKIQIDR